MLEVAANGLLELLGRAMSAATDVALRERCEPTLDLVEPGCRGRSEVDVEPRVACEPGSDRRGLVRPVVVHHEVDVQLGRDAGLDGSQEPQELCTAMPAVQLADDPPVAISSAANSVVVPCRA